MNTPTVEELTETFIAGLKSAFPGIKTVIDSDEDIHLIWHDYKNHDDTDFIDVMVPLIENLFEDNGHYNVGCAYDPYLTAERTVNKMNIIQDIIPIGRKNRPGRANPMKFITIHNTGNTSAGAGAKSHAAYVKGNAAADSYVSWHYTVDEFGAYQHIPDNEDAFHAGDGSGTGNRQSIGVEICMNSDGNLLAATDNAVLLVAILCERHNIPAGNVVQHNHWSGKNCPQMIRSGKPYNWDTFISKVKSTMDKPFTGTAIMGASVATAEQMA
jgi:N-acetyl-anhydromuramyl-L-alanine amidase AmpD